MPAETTEVTESIDQDVNISNLDDAALKNILEKDQLQDTITEDDDNNNSESTNDTNENTEESELKTEQTESIDSVQENNVEDNSIKVLEKKINKLEKTLANKELFIQRQGTELGELREELQEKAKGLTKDELNEKFLDDPAEAIRIIQDTEKAKEELKNMERLEVISKNKTVVKQFVPDFDNMLDDIVNIVKQDGANDEIIDAFRRNPYENSPDLLINLGKRAEHIKKINELTNEINSLKKKPDEILDKIEAATNSSTSITGKSSGVSSQTNTFANITEEDISNMSDAELKDFIAKSH